MLPNFCKHLILIQELSSKLATEKKCSCGGWSGWGSCGRGTCAGRGARTAGGARRPHQCPRCPQAFHSSKDMRRHAAVHTGMDLHLFKAEIPS